MMRLREKTVKKVVEALRKGFGNPEFYFFGSRCDPLKKGGDIDVAVKFSEAGFFSGKIKALAAWELMEIPLRLDIVRYGDGMDPLLKREIDGWVESAKTNSSPLG